MILLSFFSHRKVSALFCLSSPTLTVQELVHTSTAMDDDWDLQALVRSCTGTATASVRDDFDFCCKHEHLAALPDPSTEPRASFEEELHDLYKPFFPRSTSSATPAQATDPVRTSSVSSPSQNSLCFSRDLPDELQSRRLQVAVPASSARALTTPVSFTTTTTARSSQQNRSKRRKNLVKKVKHVDADELSSDVWSWRKYGQKPIKGSPYPRGYYRCSSSKGCLARKQVERNRSDPGKFIVTYTGEHNHPVPTHRNSLAGSTRQKLPTPTSAAASPPKPSCSSPSSSAEELAADSPEKLESGAELGDLMEDDVDDSEFGLSDMTVSDDFFAGLEELAGPVSVDSFADPFPGNFVLPWAAMAGGGI